MTLVVSLAVVAATAVGAIGQIAERSDSGDPGVQAILDSEFDGSCITSEVATTELNESLSAGGYGTWKVASRADGSDCVAAGLDPGSETVILFPVQSPSVTDAMHDVQDELMSRCLDKDEAIQFISSVLSGADVDGFSVLTDGPFSFPIGQQREVEQHVAEGCYVYSGSGHDADGNPVYFLSGNDG